jgi:hypothetical protein
MQKAVALLFCFRVSFLCFSQTDSAKYLPVRTRFDFHWANSESSLLLTQYGQQKDIVLIHPHDDEIASKIAAEKVLEQTGGLLIRLENNGKRLIHFEKSGRRFFFDPNRVFTAKGLQKNLNFLNNRVTPAALSSVKSFASFILQKIPESATTVVALHNNEGGQYSINSYKANGNHARDALKIYINRKKDPDDFFIVTKPVIFDKLKKAGYNVVLQNNNTAKDDGSLSIYFGKKKLSYVNVEAQTYNMEEQTKMLRKLMSILQK